MVPCAPGLHPSPEPLLGRTLGGFSGEAACSERKLRPAYKGATGGSGELATQASNESLSIDFWSRL